MRIGQFDSNLRNKEAVLTFVKNNPGITRKQIAKLMGVTPDYISRLLNWLHRDGEVLWAWNNANGKKPPYQKGWHPMGNYLQPVESEV